MVKIISKHKVGAAAVEGETWSTHMKLVTGREKAGAEEEQTGAACPHAVHRDFLLNGTFPVKDMRNQNFVKWPLGNLNFY